MGLRMEHKMALRYIEGKCLSRIAQESNMSLQFDISSTHCCAIFVVSKMHRDTVRLVGGVTSGRVIT
jgi:hypothetical protein